MLPAHMTPRNILSPKRFWVVMHHHRHGTSANIVECSHEPTEEEVVAACDIDFEPDREESIEIDRACIIPIP